MRNFWQEPYRVKCYVEGELNNKPIFAQIDHVGAYGMKGNLSFDDMTQKDHKLLRAAYWAMVDHIDTQVGRLLESLEKTGQLENTIIIFTSDHGELLGDHGIYLKGAHFYECSIHVPLIISWPKKIKGNIRCKELVELVDIAPTLIEALGLEKEEGMQGKSLMPILEGSKEKHREDVYCEFDNSNLNHANPRAYATMLFDGRYKIVKVHGDIHEIKCSGELYDLDTDPNETLNLWNDPNYTDIKLKMLERLCDRMAFVGADPLPIRKANW